MTVISVVLIDDHPLYREGVRKAITSFPDLDVIGEAGTGAEGMNLLREKRPNVAILDVNLPDDNGMQLSRKIQEENLGVHVILLTGYTDMEQPVHAFRAGCRAFCTKDIEHEQLADVVRTVAAGKWVFDGRILNAQEISAWAEERMAVLKIEGEGGSRFAPLTPRESEILQLVARGLTNKQIGYLLGISEQTVKNHLTSMLRKIGAGDRTQAVVYAIQHGWIRLPPEGGEAGDPKALLGNRDNS